MKHIFLLAALVTLGGSVHAQYGGSLHYNQKGQLVDGRGQMVSQHQEHHDLANPTLFTTGAVAVSNTLNPNFTQATLLSIEAAIAPTSQVGGLSMSRLYLTPANPYQAGVGLPSGTPQGYNFDHYNQIMLEAPTKGYVATQSGFYIAKTHEDSSKEIFNRGFNTYEGTAKFLAAKEAAGGKGGGIVFFVNQSAESFSHLKAISGSNVFMTAYVRPVSGGVLALAGQVTLNPEHNTAAALDTTRFGPAFAAGVSQIQSQTLNTGNESGFWVAGMGVNTTLGYWGEGSPSSIAAAYNPDAQFHVHSHPGIAGPSYMDMFNSASLGGMPGMVVTDGGNYAYGFVLEGGLLPTATEGTYLLFQNGWHDATSGAGWGSKPNEGGGNRGMQGIGHSAQGTRTTTVSVGASATYGMGGSLSGGSYVSRDPQGNLVGAGFVGSAQVTAGYSVKGIGPEVSVTDGPPQSGVDGIGSLTIGVGAVSVTGTYGLEDGPSLSVGGPGEVGFNVGVGANYTNPTDVGRDQYGAQADSSTSSEGATSDGPSTGESKSTGD